MNKNQKLNLQIGAGFIAVCLFTLAVGYSIGLYVSIDNIIIAAPEPVIEVPELQPTIIEVDGVGCVMGPVIRFDTDTGYTLITLECDTELLYHHLPAQEPAQ